MRKICFYLLLLLLSGVFVGCQKKENQLRLDGDKVCLVFDGQETCLPIAGGMRLVASAEGKVEMKPLQVEGLLGHLDFPQYDAPVALKGKSLVVRLSAGNLAIEDGSELFLDLLGTGIILRRGDDGQAVMQTPRKQGILPHRYEIGATTAVKDLQSQVRKIDFLKEIKSQYYMALTRIEYIIGDDQRRYIPNDTGTDVIILDGFHVVGNCNADAPTDCCSGSVAVDPALDYSGWVADYAADGRKLLVCFPAGSICTFSDGDKLIVIVCQTQERYCLDVSVCPVTITTTDEQGICFSVPLDCSLENPFN